MVCPLENLKSILKKGASRFWSLWDIYCHFIDSIFPVQPEKAINLFPVLNKGIAMDTYHLKLYITGQTANSDHAIANLRQIFERSGLDYELSIIDVLEHPRHAEEDRVLATPTLIN